MGIFCQTSTELFMMKVGDVYRDGLLEPLGGLSMSSNKKLHTYLFNTVAPVLFGAASLASTEAFAACQGPGAPTTTQTRCVTAIHLPKPLQSYDISWVNPQRAEYYLADRSNNAIDIIDTQLLAYKRSLGQGVFKGLKFN